jgi:hypothetical protein
MSLDRAFSIRKQSLLVVAGHLELDIATGDKGNPVTVRFAGVELSAEVVERVATVLGAIRGDARDYRSVCPTHGYIDRKSFGSCEECAAAEPVEAVEVKAS